MGLSEYVYCKKKDMKLNTVVCQARGCSHLKEKEGKFVCRFSPKREKLLKKRRKEKFNDCRSNSKSCGF
jgi:hypothetical protein